MSPVSNTNTMRTCFLNPISPLELPKNTGRDMTLVGLTLEIQRLFYEHIDLDDDKDEGKSIPDHVEIIQGDIYDYEDDDAV